MDFLPLILLVFTLILTIGFIWFAFDHLSNTFPGRISYVSSHLKSCLPQVEEIIRRNVDDTQAYYLLEPGGGLAHVSRHLSQAFPWKEVTVTDLGFTYLVTAKLLDWFSGTRLRYAWKNIYSARHPKPAVMYCYLSAPILARLYKQGAFKNALVITLTFAIPGAQPLEEISLPTWQERLLVYDFRTATSKS